VANRLDIFLSFFNIHDFIPDIHSTRAIKEKILLFPEQRVIKSHANYNPYYRKIIYLIRDPRDVMVSYYWHLKNSSHFKGTISQLIRSPLYGIEAWCNHVKDWVEKPPESCSIDFIRYEDIKNNSLETVSHVYKLLGYKVAKHVVAKALELSSVEIMKEVESYRNKFKNFEFVRKGGAGGYLKEMDEPDVAYINERASRWLKMFGYVV